MCAAQLLYPLHQAAAELQELRRQLSAHAPIHHQPIVHALELQWQGDARQATCVVDAQKQAGRVRG